MKNILFVYTKMIVGGSTTSLLSLLNNLDYSKYRVDLLLLDNNGELQDNITDKVNLLPGVLYKKTILRLLSLPFLYDYLRSRVLSWKHSNALIRAQIMSKRLASDSKRLLKDYDTAISFLEFWPCEYVAKNVRAKRKIAWLHIDYKAAGLIPAEDSATFTNFNNIVMVSDECATKFRQIFPQYGERTICIKNILYQKTVQDLASLSECKIETKGFLNIVSVCRVVFSPKGLDRGVEAFKKLKEAEFLDNNVRWYIIGDGPDKTKLEIMIKKYNLGNNIILLGAQKNPHIYVKDMDIFFLPSRYEGMPMAVTEAQMLGVVPLVTNYASAKEQIKDGYDGIIVENNDDSIYKSLKGMISGNFNLELLKQNIVNTNYSNYKEIEKVYHVL